MLAVSWRLEKPAITLSWLFSDIITTAVSALDANMERAAVLIGPQGYSAYEIAVANGFVGTQAQWLASLDGPQGETGPQGLPGTVPVTWAHYKDHWSAIPTPVGPTAGGSVLAYVLDVVTRYRFIPAPYDPARDAFYTTFTGGVLSGLIISRG